MTLGSRLGELRAHVNSHLAQTPFTIPDSWLSASHSCWCHCRRWITSPQVLCSSCRGAHSEIGHRRTPVADGLPLPPGPKPDIAIKLRDPGRLMPESKGLENSVSSACVEALMEMCRIDVPLLKKIPGPAASGFTKTWASLFLEAISSRSIASWRAVFMYPKLSCLPLFGEVAVSRTNSVLWPTRYWSVFGDGRSTGMRCGRKSKVVLPVEVCPSTVMAWS